MIEQRDALEYDKVRELTVALRERRIAMDKTQEQVGVDTGLSQQFISTSERLNPNSGIRAFEFFRLLKYYGMEPNEAAKLLGLL